MICYNESSTSNHIVRWITILLIRMFDLAINHPQLINYQWRTSHEGRFYFHNKASLRAFYASACLFAIRIPLTVPRVILLTDGELTNEEHWPWPGDSRRQRRLEIIKKPFRYFSIALFIKSYFASNQYLWSKCYAYSIVVRKIYWQE